MNSPADLPIPINANTVTHVCAPLFGGINRIMQNLPPDALCAFKAELVAQFGPAPWVHMLGLIAKPLKELAENAALGLSSIDLTDALTDALTDEERFWQRKLIGDVEEQAMVNALVEGRWPPWAVVAN
jgi:hypothetical protein